MSARWLVPLLIAGCWSVAPRAQAEPGEHGPLVQASLGLRAAKISDAGYDPFASSDELLQVSLGVGAKLLDVDRFSLAAVGFWDYGNHSSTARGEQSSIDVHRLSIGPEVRYQLLPPLYVFVHVLPAFAHSQASIDDPVAEVTRRARHWAFGLDAAAGAALQVYRVRNAGRFQPRFWVIGEGGYGYLGATSLRLHPESDQSAPQRTTPVDLGSLSLAGPYLRLSAAVSL